MAASGGGCRRRITDCLEELLDEIEARYGSKAADRPTDDDERSSTAEAVLAVEAALRQRLKVAHHRLDGTGLDAAYDLVSYASVPLGRLRNVALLDTDWPRLSDAIEQLGTADFVVDHGHRDAGEAARCAAAAAGGPCVIIVDEGRSHRTSGLAW